MRDDQEPRRAGRPLRSVALVLFFGGIAGSAALESARYEGPLRDLARLATVAGIGCAVVAAIRNRRK